MNKKYLAQISREADIVLDLLGRLQRTKHHPNVYDSFGIKPQINTKEANRFALLNSYAVFALSIQQVLGITPYKSQIMGALALADGYITEMATGEGKTITAAFALAWNAISGQSMIMTSNSYLAQRDAEQLTPVYEKVGLTCGYLTDTMGHSLRCLMYQRSIVYGTPSLFVFDYLRDNTALSASDVGQGTPSYLLIDEADAILIDEAKTPYILSGEADVNVCVALKADELIRKMSRHQLKAGDLTQVGDCSINELADIVVDKVGHTCAFSEKALETIEQYFLDEGYISHPKEFWQPSRGWIFRAVMAAAKANCLYTRDVDYLVIGDEVMIIDPDTGRTVAGKRWSEGVHQAIEAKEGVEIRAESTQVGRSSIADFVRRFPFKAGMTGTAKECADELWNLYRLPVCEIAPNRPCIRIQHEDSLFFNRHAKWAHITAQVSLLHERKQPVLIGTGSVAESEHLSALFTKEGIPHSVLNAKQDAQESEIIAQAGRIGAVTIATSMAGRGTDILLGGAGCSAEEKAQVVALGGLFVIGAERLESRRLDRQLEGRCARQGDPGEVQFYSSLEDELFTHTGRKQFSRTLRMFAMSENDGVSHKTISKTIQNCQQTLQGIHAESRKAVLQYDALISKPRDVFYQLRSWVLNTDDKSINALIEHIVHCAGQRLLEVYLQETRAGHDSDLLKSKFWQWRLDYEPMEAALQSSPRNIVKIEETLANSLATISIDKHLFLEQALGAMDLLWQGFLADMETAKSAIHLRAYAQIRPNLALEQEGFRFFKALLEEMPVVIIDAAAK